MHTFKQLLKILSTDSTKQRITYKRSQCFFSTVAKILTWCAPTVINEQIYKTRLKQNYLNFSQCLRHLRSIHEMRSFISMKVSSLLIAHLQAALLELSRCKYLPDVQKSSSLQYGCVSLNRNKKYEIIYQIKNPASLESDWVKP